MPRSAWCTFHTRDAPDLDAMLGRIQNDLFDLGAESGMPRSVWG